MFFIYLCYNGGEDTTCSTESDWYGSIQQKREEYKIGDKNIFMNQTLIYTRSIQYWNMKWIYTIV